MAREVVAAAVLVVVAVGAWRVALLVAIASMEVVAIGLAARPCACERGACLLAFRLLAGLLVTGAV